MIDENNGCLTKPKLTITVKTLRKYKYQSRVVAKQTNKQKGSETQKLTNIQVESILKEEKYMLTNRHTSRLTVDTLTEIVKQKNKNEAPSVLLLLE